jgi:hypothetical protein
MYKNYIFLIYILITVASCTFPADSRDPKYNLGTVTIRTGITTKDEIVQAFGNNTGANFSDGPDRYFWRTKSPYYFVIYEFAQNNKDYTVEKVTDFYVTVDKNGIVTGISTLALGQKCCLW